MSRPTYGQQHGFQGIDWGPEDHYAAVADGYELIYLGLYVGLVLTSTTDSLPSGATARQKWLVARAKKGNKLAQKAVAALTTWKLLYACDNYNR